MVPLTHCHLNGYSKLDVKVSKKHLLNLYSFTFTWHRVEIAFFTFQCWFYTIKITFFSIFLLFIIIFLIIFYYNRFCFQVLLEVCKFKIIFIFTILSMFVCIRATSIQKLPGIMSLLRLGMGEKIWLTLSLWSYLRQSIQEWTK